MGSLHPSDLAELILWILNCAIIAVHHSSPCTLRITIATNYHPNNYPQPAPVWPCCSVGRASVIKTRGSGFQSHVPQMVHFYSPGQSTTENLQVYCSTWSYTTVYSLICQLAFHVHLTSTTHLKRINYALTSLPHTTPIGPLLNLTPQRRFSDFSVNISC